MSRIESKMFYGDNPQIFKSLFGFEIVGVQTGHSNESNEDIAVIKCVNKHSVEIDILIQEGGIFVTEPFAVKENLTAVEKADGD